MPFALPHPHVTERLLRCLAALVWYVGGVVLLLKGGSLIVEAEALESGKPWAWVAAIAGVSIGIVKGCTLFDRSCRKNLARIQALDTPKLWQFYRPRFFFFLMIMMATGMALSRAAHGNYPFLLCVGTLDLSIAVALLLSSRHFWIAR